MEFFLHFSKGKAAAAAAIDKLLFIQEDSQSDYVQWERFECDTMMFVSEYTPCHDRTELIRFYSIRGWFLQV